MWATNYSNKSMMEMKWSFFLILSIFMLSCTSRQVPEVQEIGISHKMAKGKIEDLIEKFEFIQLDTCMEAHFDYATKIIYKDDTYFIESENKVLLFRNNGQFICSIDRTGRGPDEYVYLGDILYDQADKQVILSAQDNLFFFDMDGEFIRKEKPGFGFDNIHKTQDGNYAFGKIFPSGEEGNDFNLLFAKENYEILSRKTRLPVYAEGGGVMLGQSNRTNYNFGRDYYFSLYCDSVFRIEGARIIPELVFSYDKDVFSLTGAGQKLDRDNNYLGFTYAETENHRLLSFSLNWINYLAIIDKDSYETRVIECGYNFDISNLDGNTFLQNMNSYFLEEYQEFYKQEKCINQEVFEQFVSNPESLENVIVRMYLDL